MPRFRLRYQATDLELPLGEFVIGRSSACSLALDDALVSRRHAVFRTTEDAVNVEDLGSRNGILVNGEKSSGLRKLGHLDRVTIGGQELVLVEMNRKSRGAAPTGSGTTCGICGTPSRPKDKRCSGCGAPLSSALSTLAGQTLELKVPLELIEQEDTSQASGFMLMATIADKALALGRYDEAERMLEKHLVAMTQRAANPTPRLREELDRAAIYALRLAEGLSEPGWIDWVFDTFAAAGFVLPGSIANDLYDLVRRVRYQNPRALRGYLAALQPKRQSLSAADRFILQRLQGLLRVVTA